MFTRYTLVIVCLLLQACASVRPVAWPWPEGTKMEGSAANANKLCDLDKCNATDARRALSAASNYCSLIIQRQDGDSILLGSSKVLVGTFGALSGSVISQFAQGSAAKAWSGMSGVTNGMQTQMDQAFSGAIDIRRKQQIAEAATEGAKAFENVAAGEQKYDKQVEQAIQMALACAVNGAKADGIAMQLLNGGSPNPTGSSSFFADPGIAAALQGKATLATPAIGTVEDRLRKLRSLLEQGLIDQVTFDREQQRITAEL